jgi:hypothetical protein
MCAGGCDLSVRVLVTVVTALGLIGAALFLLTAPSYLWSAVRGSTTPHPLSWAIWSTLGAVGAAATASAGGGPVVILLAITVLLEVTVFFVSLRSFPRPFTGSPLPLVAAVTGAAVWLTADSPLAGAVGVVVADASGLWPTLRKTWADPNSEPPIPWAVGALAFLLGCLSVSRATPAALLYPGYLFAGNALVAGAAYGRRRHGPPSTQLQG